MLTTLLLSSVLALSLALAARWRHAVRRLAQVQEADRRTAALGPEEVRAIRDAAEDAALQVALGRAGFARNPHRTGTRQAILWTTSFNLRLMELETEAFAPAPAVPAFIR